MNVRVAGFVLLFSFLVAGAASADAPPGAYAYADLFERVRTSARPAPIESLLVFGLAVGDSLPPLDQMDDSTLARTASLMQGFELLHDGVYEGLAPNFAFFDSLAREKGDDADVAIFRTIRATMNDGYMPSYVQQQTDYSGCTRFGSGALVEAYGLWKSFLERYPGRYVARSTMDFEDVRDELLSGDCACDDRASVVRELDLFLKRYPRGVFPGLVRARREEVRSGKAKIREHC